MSLFCARKKDFLEQKKMVRKYDLFVATNYGMESYGKIY